MPVRQRKPSELTQQVIPLLLLGIGLVTTNNSASFLEDEARTLNLAIQPVRVILTGFFSGNQSSPSQPPLFDILLHFWLRWTGGNFDFLRIPSVLFFVAGLFLLGRASRHWAGAKGGAAVIWTGVLWPFGFHYGRLAVASLFSFFLVCGLTFAYQKYLEEQSLGRWAALLLFCLALTWTSYFGWAILICLAIDLALRLRKAEFGVNLVILAGSVAVLGAAFVPFLAAIRRALPTVSNMHPSAQSILVNVASGVYSFFVSESVAPWDWRFSIPAALGVLLSVVLVTRWTPSVARRLLLYSAGLIVAMALTGILDINRLLILSPWVLLPIGIAIEAAKPRWATFALAAALLIVGAIGWYGIYSRRYYSAPQFIEPWQEIAADAAGKIGGGATVIADQPSFLFYLTYILHAPSQNGPWRFEGLLPDTVKHQQVFSPAGWLAAGHPTSGKMILIRGARDQEGSGPIEDAARQLDQSCGSISSRLRVRDEGYKWKQRFFPQIRDPQWRIEIRDYDCDSSNSKQIYRIPPR